MEFYNYKNKLERPFVVYMDCEASLIPMEIRDNEKNTTLLKNMLYIVVAFILFVLLIHLEINYMILEVLIVCLIW